MLKVSYQILDPLELVLKVFFYLTPDIVYKNSLFPKAFRQKNFKFIPNRRDCTITLNLGLVLLPPEDDAILQKKYYKKYMSRAINSNCFEIVFALMIK